MTDEFKTHHVFVVSDGSGMTAEQALFAAMTQFAGVNIEVIRRPQVRTEDQVHRVIHEAQAIGGFILHTLVTDKLRRLMLNLAREHNIDTIDLMGPLLSRLSQQFIISPSEKPGLFRQLNEEYFRRIETMEFAFHHDDGMRAEELTKAEMVLVGVSRTFKTPLSIFLAFKGWLVGNIPIILDVEPPPVLFEIPPEKVFGLTMDPGRMAMLRLVRHQHLGGKTGTYADADFVKRELRHAMRLFRKPPAWNVIDVTSKPIEEIASEILALVPHGEVSTD